MDIRVASYGVIVDGERILLAHWNESGRSGWTLPGGGIEAGEDPADAARREILEETGYVAELDSLLGIDSRIVPATQRLDGSGRPLHAIRIIYRAHIVSGKLTNELEGTTDEAAWFRLGEVPNRRVELVNVALGLIGASA